MKDSVKLNREEILLSLKKPGAFIHSAEIKNHAFFKHFKALTLDARIDIMRELAEIMHQRFEDNLPFSDLTLLLVGTMAAESDWESSLEFLQQVAFTTRSSEYLRDFALNLVDISDNEMSGKNSKLPLAQCALVLLSEFGLNIANSSGKTLLPPKEIGYVVDFVTSNMLAKSNINHSAVRVSLVHYLASFPVTTQSSLQLNRVISRFGQTLLDELLKAFFEDKRKGNAAFFFLVEHLNCFFTSSPALADMAQGTLKHYMFKHPDEFPSFLSGYLDCMKKSFEVSLNSTKHLTMLAMSSVTIGQTNLTTLIGNLVFKHVKATRDMGRDVFMEHVQMVRSVLGSRILPGLEPMMKSFEKLEQSELQSDYGSGSVVYLAKLPKKLKGSKALVNKVSDKSHKPTPLETMLQLAV
jgi:hypothetical protein